MRREEGQGSPLQEAGCAQSGVRAGRAAFAHILIHEPSVWTLCMLERPDKTEKPPSFPVGLPW